MPRLARLTGEDEECCAGEYTELAKEIADAPRFAVALGRAKALADDRRLTAVALLRRRKVLCACEIQAVLGVTHATVSHHMGVLGSAGIVSAERRGKWMYYRLTPKVGVEIP